MEPVAVAGVVALEATTPTGAYLLPLALWGITCIRLSLAVVLVLVLVVQ